MAKGHISRPTASCQRCNEQYQKHGNYQKYCDNCRHLLKLERGRETRLRSAVKEGRQIAGTKLTCVVCGLEFISRPGLPNKYCSRKCSRFVENQRRTSARRAAGVAVMIGHPFACRMCGAQVVATSPSSRYCEGCVKIAVAEKGRKWREANPDKRREVDRVQHAKQVQRRQSDPVEMDRHREWVRKYHQEKRKVPRYRLDHRISQLVRNGLNGTKSGRTWESLVGYSIADLMVHLEKQFLPGMGWHNMHKWHVDHIIPRAHFDYRSSDDEEFKACWAMSNLRPLWSEDNIKKGASRLLLL